MTGKEIYSYVFIIMLLNVHLKKLNPYIGREGEQELENP